MPRIKPEHETCVFFLMNEQRDEVLGSGFIVGRTTPGPGLHLYGVTNHHVFQRGGRKIRINIKNGGTREIYPDEEWEFSQNDDLAAVDLTDYLNDDDEYSYISERDFVSEEFIDKAKVAIGDEVFLIGMFSDNPGTSRNLASGRFGSLSMMASADFPVAQVGYPAKPSFIADMRSRPGYSGSPVFVYRTQWVDLRSIDSSGVQHIDLGVIGEDPGTSTFVKMLGVHCAQYIDEVEIKATDDGQLDGKKIRIAGAMTIIVPAWRVQALLDTQNFEKIRVVRDRERALSAATMNESTQTHM